MQQTFGSRPPYSAYSRVLPLLFGKQRMHPLLCMLQLKWSHTDPLLYLLNYLWMMAERSMVGLPTEVLDRKISIPKLHLSPSVDAASLRKLSRCNILRTPQRWSETLSSQKKTQALRSSYCGTRRPLSTLAVFNCVSLITQWCRTKRGLFRVRLRDRCFWNPYGWNARKATGVAFWIGIC
jgi:hypothetical protein